MWSALRPQRLDPDKRTCQTAKSLLISDGDKAMDTVEVREFEIYLARAIASGINLAAAVGMEDSVGQQFQDEVSSVYSLPISSPPPPSPPDWRAGGVPQMYSIAIQTQYMYCTFVARHRRRK